MAKKIKSLIMCLTLSVLAETDLTFFMTNNLSSMTGSLNLAVSNTNIEVLCEFLDYEDFNFTNTNCEFLGYDYEALSYDIVFQDNKGRPVVRICTTNGNVEIGGSFTPNEATTNFWHLLEEFYPYLFPDKTTDERIKKSAKEGRICKLYGHSWRNGRQGESYDVKTGLGGSFADYHPNINYRTCRICGKCQSQSTEWK